MKKIYKINLFKVPGGVLRRSVLHQLSFYTKIVAYILGKLKPNKKKVKIDNTGLNKKLKKIWQYTGEIKKLVPHGKGEILSDQYDFKGVFINGKANGLGEENNKNLFGLGKYKGEFVNNSRHGKGTFFFYDGSKYIGDWKNNYKHGKGTYIWKDGFKLEGKWFKDLYKDFGDEYTLIERVELTDSPTIKYKGYSFEYIDHNSKKKK